MGRTGEAPNRADDDRSDRATALGLGYGSSSTHSVKRRPWGTGDPRLWSPPGNLPGDARRQGAAKLPAWRRHVRREPGVAAWQRGRHRPPGQEGAVLEAAREEQSFYWSFVLREAGLGELGIRWARGSCWSRLRQEGQGPRAPSGVLAEGASLCPSGNVPRLRLALAPGACCVSVHLALLGGPVPPLASLSLLQGEEPRMEQDSLVSVLQPSPGSGVRSAQAGARGQGSSWGL